MSNPTSTLSEINMQLKTLLHTWFTGLTEVSEHIKDLNQIVYSPTDTWENHQYEIRRVMRGPDNQLAPDIKLPFVAFSRGNNVNSALVGRPQYKDTARFHKSVVGDESEVDSYKIQPVELNYNITIYDDSNEVLEFYVDRLVLEGIKKLRVRDYMSTILGVQCRISALFELPRYNLIPDHRDKTKGKGFIYSLIIPVTVNGVLGIGTKSKVIKTAIMDTHLDKPMVDPLTDEYDTRVIVTESTE